MGSPHCRLAPLRPHRPLGPLLRIWRGGVLTCPPVRPVRELPPPPPPEHSRLWWPLPSPSRLRLCHPWPPRRPVPPVVPHACPPFCMVSWEKRDISSTGLTAHPMNVTTATQTPSCPSLPPHLPQRHTHLRFFYKQALTVQNSPHGLLGVPSPPSPVFCWFSTNTPLFQHLQT